MSSIPFASPAAAPSDAALGNVILDAHGRIDEDIACRKCGYNLRTLLPDGRCPECGTAVGRSIQGDYLRFCDPEWVKKLASGMNWIVAGIVIALCVGGCGGFGFGLFRTNPTVFPLVMLGLGIIPLVGYWKLTTPDPAKLEESSTVTTRKLVRVTQVLEFGLQGGTWLPQLSGAGLILAATVVNQIVGIVGFFAVFVYARKLALRIPNDKLARHCRIVMWGLVGSTGLAIVFGIIAYLAAYFAAPAGPAVFVGPVTTLPSGSSPASGPTAGPPAPAAALAAAGSTPNFFALALGGILFGLGCLVFGIWSLILILRFRRAFGEASQLALATWAAARPMRGT